MSDAEDNTVGCQHYERHCALVSPCCGKIYVCRFCHDENETHEIDRHSVVEIQCLNCKYRQPVGRECIRCGQLFGKYFCEICRLYDDKDKQQFHCDECGMCRIEGKDNFFHCMKCGICMANSLKGSHQCIENIAHSDCPVCLEDMYKSRTNLKVLKCGHLIHVDCCKNLLSSRMYRCPLCQVSMIEMSPIWRRLDELIASNPMSEGHRDNLVMILCRDCHLTSETLFHLIGLKCMSCGSYNTCRTPSSSTDQEASAHESTTEAAFDNIQSLGVTEEVGAQAGATVAEIRPAERIFSSTEAGALSNSASYSNYSAAANSDTVIQFSDSRINANEDVVRTDDSAETREDEWRSAPYSPWFSLTEAIALVTIGADSGVEGVDLLENASNTLNNDSDTQ